ncbi:DUF5680 domain-containing protein [[Eubacterium] hominis]|uniref:DUF5680 domain-containing protein n=1 Tax=[Eubacterium] hominis TaxID=2764325 RepID=UPI003A4D3A5F
MNLEDRLQLLRKRNGYSQEQLSEKIGIARQTISKWENGQAIPELNGLIRLSELYGVTIDRIVKDEECNLQLNKKIDKHIDNMIAFLINAKKNTYSISSGKVQSSRIHSHDYSFEDLPYKYYDTFLGNEKFSGEEAIWFYDDPVWCLNYSGRVLRHSFDSGFLKEALSKVSAEFPYRGPRIFTKGDYHYHCHLDGDFTWFQGYEEIFYLNDKVYECCFHGGIVE